VPTVFTFDRDSELLANWLSQFDVDDQPIATKLLEELVYVSYSEMRIALTKAIVERGGQIEGCIGLYAERHVRHYGGKPTRLFVAETVTKKRGKKSHRSEGIGPDPVVSQRRHAHDTGSEGIIAQMITQICKAYPEKFFDHPGPMHIRPNQVRSFMLVTDFIGSGQRAVSYLKAAWRVRSVRSWWSLGWMKFDVISYAGTSAGAERVRSLRCAPTVRTVIGCPTISDLPPPKSHDLIRICKTYGPNIKAWKTTPLGYRNTGALLVFEHGAPNNTPYLLHGASEKWTPLFPQRTTFQTAKVTASGLAASRIKQRLEKLGRERLAHLQSLPQFGEQTQQTALVLASLRKRPRTVEAVSANTGLTTFEVEATILRAQASGFLTPKLQPTDKAFTELAYLKQLENKKIPVPKGSNAVYFPTVLRPPKGDV
jgi:hypothetical protein